MKKKASIIGIPILFAVFGILSLVLGIMNFEKFGVGTFIVAAIDILIAILVFYFMNKKEKHPKTKEA